MKGDQLVDRAATRLQALADRAAAEGEMGAKVAHYLAADAAFLRKLKPSLIVARIRHEAPVGQNPGHGAGAPSPPSPKPAGNPRPPGSGPSPLLIIGAAIVVGILAAKIVDWRSNAHASD